MSALAFLALSAGGALGRYYTALVLLRWSGRVPLGTLVVNVTGSFVLGLVAAGVFGRASTTAIGTGGCGALTTFSTFAAETVASGRRRGTLIVALHLVLGLGAAALGLAVG